jgi:5-formyltetrahydrofolate cyclo-ligase
LGAPSPKTSTRKTFAFAHAGTYFPAVRASARRIEDDSLYARPKNLSRVRIVVAGSVAFVDAAGRRAWPT